MKKNSLNSCYESASNEWLNSLNSCYESASNEWLNSNVDSFIPRCKRGTDTLATESPHQCYTLMFLVVIQNSESGYEREFLE